MSLEYSARARLIKNSLTLNEDKDSDLAAKMREIEALKDTLSQRQKDLASLQLAQESTQREIRDLRSELEALLNLIEADREEMKKKLSEAERLSDPALFQRLQEMSENAVRMGREQDTLRSMIDQATAKEKRLQSHLEQKLGEFELEKKQLEAALQGIIHAKSSETLLAQLEITS